MHRVWEPKVMLKKTDREMKPLCHLQGEALCCHSLITSSTSCSREEVLQLVTQLYINTEIVDKYCQEFFSKKITNKLITKI